MKNLNNMRVPAEAEKLYFVAYQDCDCGYGGYRIPELITDDISKVSANGMYYYTDMKGVFQPITNPELVTKLQINIILEDKLLSSVIAATSIYVALTKQGIECTVSEDTTDNATTIVVSKETSKELLNKYDHYWLKYLYKVARKEEEGAVVEKEGLGTFGTDRYIFFNDGDREFVFLKGTLDIYKNIKTLECVPTQKVEELLKAIS